jgi:tRNA nucleotidyltransferase/poly(A) polymerase
VQYSQSKEEDVKRRDFTVNALLMDPFTNEVFDFVEGLKDLEAGLIRAVGNPDRRFQEDRLRLLRAIRFASRFGFEIETQTMNAICAHAEFIKDVSEERIVMELHGIWSSSRPEHGMALLTKTGLTTAIFNDLPQAQCAEFIRRFGIYATCAKGEIAENQQALGWALVFDLCEIERLDMSLRSLKLSRSLMRKIQNVLSMKKSLLSVQTLQTAQSIRTALADDFQLALCFLQAIQNEDSACLDTWRRIQDELRESPLPALPLLTGRQLADLGYTPGPIFKKILRAVEDEVFERRLCTTDEALLWVQAQDWSQ